MSTQETVKLTIELIVSNGMGEGELPDDETLAASIQNQIAVMRFYETGQTVKIGNVKVLGRTGELDAPSFIAPPLEEGDPCPSCGEPLEWDRLAQMLFCKNDWRHG